MRIHLGFVLALTLLGLPVANADTIHARLKQPKSAACLFHAFNGFGTYLALSQGDAIVGEDFGSRTATPASPQGDGCTVVFADDGMDDWNVKQILPTSGPIATFGDRMLVGLSLYAYDGNAWQAGPMLLSPAKVNQSYMSVALGSGVAVIGNSHDTAGGFSLAGSVSVIRLSASGNPASIAKLTAATPVQLDEFGSQVSLVDDVLAVRSVSSVYIFERQSSGNWLQTARLDPGACHCAALMSGIASVAVLNSNTVAYADITGAVHVLHRAAPAKWTPQVNLHVTGEGWIYLAADAGRFAIGSPNDPSVEPAGGSGAVITYGVMDDAISIQQQMANPDGILWFGGPLALDSTHLLVGEDVCQDGLPCTPLTVDVVEADSGTSQGSRSGGSGEFGLLGLVTLAMAGLLRRRH